ncbi:MAG: hypothetical protein HRT38_14555 [Alteromonadaceae bacterium]|nr:hypothetical protein [Alteromonadaceae bacterium]
MPAIHKRFALIIENTAITKLSGIKLAVTFHDLSSNWGNLDYGTELDFVATYKFANRYNFFVALSNDTADVLALILISYGFKYQLSSRVG